MAAQPAKATSATALTGFWEALPSLLWVLFAFVVLLVFRSDLKGLVQHLIWRVRSGAALKLASFELGASYVSPSGTVAAGESSVARRDDDGRRYRDRERFYRPNRNIHLVHRVAPSQKPGQLYDILIYVVPHRDASLASVKEVQYYFGRHWGGAIFASLDRARSFAIATSAFGPFMCTAELHFTDGEVVTIARYVDFEMGAIGKTSPQVRAGA